MSLDPSPLSPRPTPLLNPTEPAPGRGSALIGGAVAIVLAVVIAFVSLTYGTRLLFLPQGMQAHANAALDQLPQIQGFSDYWTKSFDAGSTKVGYGNAEVNQNIMQDEASTYHMNLAVITITADMTTNTDPSIFFGTNDHFTYRDQVYKNLVAIARTNNLTPAFRLEVRLTAGQGNNYASTQVGQPWISPDAALAADEATWFDNYAKFASHYADLAQQLQVPLFILGSDLSYITIDNSLTGQAAKKQPGKKWGNYTDQCFGRRDCEWRFVIDAVRSTTYAQLYSKKATQKGGGYSGVMTFASVGQIDPTGQKAYLTPEWQNIKFWDALNVIGIDAFFPLTSGVSDPAPGDLERAWKGQYISGAPPTNGEGDIFKQMRDLSDQYNRRVLFTGAGYESLGGATQSPGSASGLGTTPDDQEQQNDMQGLLQTFASETWWLGVIWSYDYPVWPRTDLDKTNTQNGNDPGLLEPNYETNTEWAGKQGGGGTYLSTYYKDSPLTDSLWESLIQP